MGRRRRWAVVSVVAVALVISMAPAGRAAPPAGSPVAIDEVGAVVLVDAGRAPRSPLRYKGGDNVRQTMTMTMEMAIDTPPGQPATRMKFKMHTSQAAAPSGSVRVTFHASDLEVIS